MFLVYGVRQYGKANASERFGVCNSCGRTAILETYDTARFFHLYWLPLIPVGHERIIDACPLCGKCHKMSSLTYKRRKKKNDNSLMERLRETPNDPELVCEALQHWSFYKDDESFERMATLALSRMSGDMKVIKSTAIGYYRLGRFSKAQEIARKLPESDPARQELIETAEAHLETAGGETDRPKKKSGISIFLPYLVPLLIIIAICGSIFSEAHTAGKARAIWLVNGSLCPYKVQIDDKEYVIKKQAVRTITLPMGQHHVQIKDTRFPMEPVTFEYDVSFIDRLNDNKTLVLNPDGLAFLTIEHVPYIAENSHAEAESRYEYLFGKTWYILPAIDYAFRSIPDNVPMPSGVNVTYKSQLSLYEPESYIETLNALYNNDGEDTVRQFAKTALRLDPESPDVMWLLSLAQGTNDLASVELMNSALKERPVLIDWHRYYQEAEANKDPEKDLVAEYQALLDAEPGNPALLYLRGRVDPDYETAQQYYLRSDEGTGCGGYGYYAAAYNLMYRMQYSEAHSLLIKAMKNEHAQSRFGSLYDASCLATHSYQPLIESIQKQKCVQPENGELVAQEVRFLHLQEKHDEAKRVIKTYYSINLNWMDASTRAEWQTYYDAIADYVAGDIPAYLAKLQSVLPEQADYQSAFHKGEIQKVMDLLTEAENTDFTSYLLAYAAAMQHDQMDIAEKALQTAVNLLEARFDILPFINNLAVAPEELEVAEILPEEKLYVALALGCLHSDKQDAYFEIANKCNYSPYFPQHLIRQLTR